MTLDDRSQPPGNCAQLESVGMDKGDTEGRKRTRVNLRGAGEVLLGFLQPYHDYCWSLQGVLQDVLV